MFVDIGARVTTRKMLEVKIIVQDGIVHLIECPEGVVVRCLDHDQGEVDYFELDRPL